MPLYFGVPGTVLMPRRFASLSVTIEKAAPVSTMYCAWCPLIVTGAVMNGPAGEVAYFTWAGRRETTFRSGNRDSASRLARSTGDGFRSGATLKILYDSADRSEERRVG